MKLPNGDGADLGTKIGDYVLNLRHWDGRHRARVFGSASVLRWRTGDLAFGCRLKMVVVGSAIGAHTVCIQMG
jgi:hypothetical protein